MSLGLSDLEEHLLILLRLRSFFTKNKKNNKICLASGMKFTDKTMRSEGSLSKIFMIVCYGFKKQARYSGGYYSLDYEI